MILSIKNMVCDRCILAVKQQLEKLNYTVPYVTLGKATIEVDLNNQHLLTLGEALHDLGFELIDNEKGRLIESVKNVIITQIHHSDLSELHISYSELISRELNKDYTYLSRIFSEVERTTIERFIIHQKIEKVKELLEYQELNLNEISWKMGYSSSAHLSAQFKQITGVSPTKFKCTFEQQRKPLDSF